MQSDCITTKRCYNYILRWETFRYTRSIKQIQFCFLFKQGWPIIYKYIGFYVFSFGNNCNKLIGDYEWVQV